MRRLLASTVLLLAGLAGPASAQAAEQRSVRAGEAVDRVCQDRLLGSGTGGVAAERFTAARSGIVTAELDGAGGDWDLALFSAEGRRDAGAASFGASERASAFLREGETLVAQACRRSGAGASATLAFDLSPASPATRRDVAQLVEVPLALPADLERLEATGLDVTHDVSATGAKVVLYGTPDVRRLTGAGFTFRSLVPDLRAADAARARSDALRTSRSALPSGRTTYRVYEDYGNDLKDLVAKHPGLVRPVTIGQSLEGRAIEGVEIADGVNRDDDGRPVFAVLGLHHAREWPSGEMPIEFARDLAQRFSASDARVRGLLQRVRVLVLPMMNPDGFVVSRSAYGGMTGP